MAGNKKDKTTTIILGAVGFFTGIFGIQRFYLGQVGMGLLYLFTIGLCGIGQIVDIITFATMSDQEFDAKYNGGSINFIKTSSEPRDVAEELTKLADLMERGVITFEEFEKRKSQLLNNS